MSVYLIYSGRTDELMELNYQLMSTITRNFSAMILAVVASTVTLGALAQDGSPYCASSLVHEHMMTEDASYMLRTEQQLEGLHRESQSREDAQKSSTVYTVPLVVHIMHNGEALGTGSNISDAQVHSAIQALNDDFRKAPGTSGDGNGVDVEIEFCLASVGPDGYATSGIMRVDASSVPSYSEEGITAGQVSGADEISVKNLSRWDRNDYYNIWVVSEIEANNGGGGIQGYAYFPSSSVVRDGTVILYNAFGTVGSLKSYTNLNKVLTHEIGHAFYLYHSFEGNSCSESYCDTQGDRVCDTPPTSLNPNCNSPACAGNQQVENYMDYSSQACLSMFTQGQKDRMHNALTQFRSGLVVSAACGTADPAPIAPCVGDLNEDGMINVEDFILLNGSMGQTCTGCYEDIDGDGQVSVEDFIILNSVYGTTCGEE